MRVRGGGVESGGEDGSETGSVMEKRKNNLRTVLMPASPRTSEGGGRVKCMSLTPTY